MKDDRVYLLHIRDAIDQIFEYITADKAQFLEDRKTQDAVARNLEIIGEAVKRLSPALRAAQPEIPWKRIAGTRDKMIHDYFGVDWNLVWQVVEKELPALAAKVRAMLADEV